jgi:Holliday junction DNA helicase RuvA
VIATLRGALIERTDDGAVVEAAGVGYAVFASAATRERLPAAGGQVFLHIVESVAMYGGGVSLYGFLSVDEKRIFLALKENVPGAGAKKALELLDKAAKSLPDFRRAIIDEDAKSLVTLFGFTAKTAEKIVAGLKGKMDVLAFSAGAARERPADMTSLNEAVQGLVALGYRDGDAREAAQAAQKRLGAAAASEALIRDALRRLSGRT